jgi:uncharacterized protein (DUF433 family)
MLNMGTAFGTGLFTVPEAAELIGARASVLRRWFVRSGSRVPLFEAERVGKHTSLTFADLVTALFIRAFHNHGVSMQKIRRAAVNAARDLGTDRPFAMRRFRTDGSTILMWLETPLPDEGPHLVDATTNQAVISQVIGPLLHKVEYNLDDTARRWWPMGTTGHVVVDPEVSFGRPTIAGRGVQTRVLAGPVRAGDPPGMVAEWFGVTEAEVLAACEFERMIHAEAA